MFGPGLITCFRLQRRPQLHKGGVILLEGVSFSFKVGADNAGGVAEMSELERRNTEIKRLRVNAHKQMFELEK